MEPDLALQLAYGCKDSVRQSSNGVVVQISRCFQYTLCSHLLFHDRHHNANTTPIDDHEQSSTTCTPVEVCQMYTLLNDWMWKNARR